MTFSDFVLDAFFQSLILADIGLAISLILRRQKTTVAFFAENSYLRERWSQTREHPRFLFT